MTRDGSAPAVEAVVFDCGGVLVDWNPRHLYRKLFPGDEPAMERFLATVCTPEWNAEQDRGRPFAEGVARLVEEHPEHATLIRAYHERWDEMVPGAIDETVAVLAELRDAGIATYILSNWSAETFPRVAPRFGFLEWFDGIVLSGEEGVVKPDPAIFRVLCERYGLVPQASLFVDDSPGNVEAARSLGFPAHHFRRADALRRELADLGLLAP